MEIPLFTLSPNVATAASVAKEPLLLPSYLFIHGRWLILLPVVVAYYVLWYFPNWFWKRKQLGPKGTARIIAHRGSTAEGLPENTLSAFKDAVKAGAEIIEFDVYMTKDGHIVVHHDDNFSRMCGETADGKIWEFNYHQFPKITPPGHQKDRTHKHEQEHWTQIPLLSEVLDVIPPHINMVVEFKQDSDELIEGVRELLQKKRRTEHVFWFSLQDTINKKLRAADSNIHTMCSIPDVLKILGCYYLGILPFMYIEDAVFGITTEEITLQRIQNEKALKGAPDFLVRFLARVLSGKPPWAMCAPKLFAHLRSRGIPVWFMGVNSEEDVLLAVQAGATGVLTDRINWLVEHLKQNNLLFEKIYGHHEEDNKYHHHHQQQQKKHSKGE